MKEPFIIKFPKIGTEEKGFLVPFEHIPFPIEHVYCIGPVPKGESRGNHAKKSNQVIVAIGGYAIFSLEAPDGFKQEFRINSNTEGLIIPEGYWRSVKIYEGGYLIVMNSSKYSINDYINDYDEFTKMNNR